MIISGAADADVVIVGDAWGSDFTEATDQKIFLAHLSLNLTQSTDYTVSPRRDVAGWIIMKMQRPTAAPSAARWRETMSV